MLDNPIEQAKLKTESFDSLFKIWKDPESRLDWDCLFVLPPWLKAWWNTFGSGKTLHICSVSIRGKIIGVAPLYISGNTAVIIGDRDVSDYTDFIIEPGKEMHFFRALFDHLQQKGVVYVDLGHVLRNSPTISFIMTNFYNLKCIIHSEPSGNLYDMGLPHSWKEYLYNLTKKKRHEIRRKLRRLHEAGNVDTLIVEEAEQVNEAMDIFFKIFRMNIPGKSDFLTAPMESFFRLLATEMAKAGFLRLMFLDVDREPAASVICFDYRNTVYLYNNGYDSMYQHLSVGYLSKALAIKASIQKGKSSFNFLKGDEKYKQDLGGKPVQLQQARIELK